MGIRTTRNLISSTWNNAWGKAQDMGHAPGVSIAQFGGEGTGVRALVQSTSRSGLGWWEPNVRMIFHLRFERHPGMPNATIVTTHVRKGPGMPWIFYARQLRHDNPGNANQPSGTFIGAFTFLEDYGGNRAYRGGAVHGAWFKRQSGGQWETASDVRGSFGAQPPTANMYITPKTDPVTGYQMLSFATGGNRNDGNRNGAFSGRVNFRAAPGELYNIP